MKRITLNETLLIVITILFLGVFTAQGQKNLAPKQKAKIAHNQYHGHHHRHHFNVVNNLLKIGLLIKLTTPPPPVVVYQQTYYVHEGNVLILTNSGDYKVVNPPEGYVVENNVLVKSNTLVVENQSSTVIVVR